MKTDRSGASVGELCQALMISRSGYYAWRKRKPSARTRRNQALTRALVHLHEKYLALGLDSLYHMLRPDYGCSRKRVRRLIRHNLSAVKDLCTKKVVGYAFSSPIDTQLTLDALDMAIRREKPVSGFIFHSDRGVQYAAAAYPERLTQFGIRQSMSRKGDPYDNAVAESFFSCLKCELIHLRRFDTRAAAQNAVFAYIEGFYISLLPHSAIGWIPPNVFAKQFSQAAVA